MDVPLPNGNLLGLAHVTSRKKRLARARVEQPASMMGKYEQGHAILPRHEEAMPLDPTRLQKWPRWQHEVWPRDFHRSRLLFLFPMGNLVLPKNTNRGNGHGLKKYFQEDPVL